MTFLTTGSPLKNAFQVSMSNVLLYILNHCDLQFSREVQTDFSDYFLMENAENQEFFVIKKGQEFEDSTFHKRSACIKRWYFDGEPHTNKIFDYLRFPLLEKTIQHFLDREGPINRLLICSILQSSSHKFDTNHIGQIALKFFQQRYRRREEIQQVKALNMTIIPTRDELKKIPHYCLDFLEQQKKDGFATIYISNEAGLPIVANASNLTRTIFKAISYCTSIA